MRASQPKAWPVECHVVSYRVAPHSCMAGRLDPLMWNIITLTFLFLFLAEFYLIWFLFIYRCCSGTYTRCPPRVTCMYVESMLIQTPWWISMSRIISTCFCIGFGFHYLSKTRLLDHKFYVVKLTLNPKVHNNLPKFGWGNASFIYPRRRPTNFCTN